MFRPKKIWELLFRPNRCFSECKSLASVTFDPDTKVSRFDGNAFCRSGLSSIHIHSSVEVICESCFCACKSLASVTFNSGTKVSRFDDYAFCGSGLPSIRIPSSVEVICERCFSGCTSLASVTFEVDTRVYQFDRSAFCGSGLTSIHIPSSVEVICEGCFLGCKSLASVTHDPDSKLHPTLSALLAGAPLNYQRRNCAERPLFDRFGDRIISKFPSSNLSKPSNRLKIWVILDGCAFSDSSFTLIRIPSSVEVICEFSFSRCKYLVSVEVVCRTWLSLTVIM
jgi:hypothetical protein